ncbi:MAG TPA: alpha/beta hydrolase [Jatrophihabitans sp.]|uniref:alpha/beta hydrolase n=1 Tax=Jatrophihabitans sp. TaxID=1932789 RepID=UPI002E032655|nr:alpha/beta hydrolase [Jatrophihabitans sp.]
MTRSRTVLAAAIAAIMLTGACSSTISGHGTAATGARSPSAASSAPSTATPSLPAQPPADFTDCRSAFRLDAVPFPAGRADRLSFACATISVPLDYSDRGGRTISLQLVKIHDSHNTANTGKLLVNPGGPGVSGVELSVSLAAQLSDTVMSHFDLIGFDPRGVGLSSPIRCLSDQQKDDLNAASPDVLTTAGFAAAKQAARSVADACNAKYGASLAQYDTVQTARDMDRIRQAVGDSRMNYLGFSYGTELGSVYAHLFPGTIRVAVLDGAVDPLTDDITSFADQLQGFESSFDQFAQWCDQHDPCRSLGNPRQAVYDIAKKATTAPLRSSKSGETRTATSAIVYTGVLYALYSKSLWSQLGSALIAAGKGDSAGLFTLADGYNERFDGHYTNVAEANTTINCNDSKPGPTDDQIRTTARSWITRFPMFGLWSAPSLFSCQQWQPARSPVPLPTAPTPQKVLVIGNLHDPATPYQGAKDLARTMGNAELLTWDGEGHTSYLQGSSCIDKYVDAYLVSITLPPTGTTCPR